MTRPVHIFLLCAMALAGCQRSPAGEATQPAAASLTVHDGAGATGPFRLDAVSRLVIECSYPATPGPHAQRIDVFDPHGALYGSLRAEVQVGPDGRATWSQALEVAGTPIQHYAMTGAWSFVLTRDDGPPLAAATIDMAN